MSEGPAFPGTVVLVDPDERLRTVAAAIRQGGVESVRTVPDVDALGALETEVACVFVPDAPATDDHAALDGIEYLKAVRERLEDVPVAVYVLGDGRDPVVDLLKAGADTVIRVPPTRSAVLVSRLERLVDVDDREPPLQQFRSLMEHYPEAVYLKDTDSRFVRNTQFAFDGYDESRMTPEQVVGLTDYELYDRALADELFEEEQELMAREESMIEKITHYRENGEDRWVSTTKVPRYDAENELLGLVGDVRDVTRIKRQERMMATLHEASRRLVRADGKRDIGTVAVDITTEMDALPRARVDLFDEDKGVLEPVAAATDDELVWDPASFQTAATSGRSQYRTDTGEFVAVDTDTHDHDSLDFPADLDSVSGVRIPLGDHGVLGVDAGDDDLDPFTVELTHVLASNVEAALDRAEQQRRLTEQAERLEEFALLGSHELRNRLQIALGTAERARAQDDIGAVDDVIETLGRMNRLVTQLLTLARTGAVSQSTQKVALSGIAETAWATVDSEAAILETVSDGIVSADRDGLLEVFEMLFRMAVDSGGSGFVRVGTTPDGFFIADDGSAVTPDQHDDLLEPTYTAVDGGTGDSIYLVSVIADAHDWTVDVSEDEAGWTRFTFSNVDVKRVQ